MKYNPCLSTCILYSKVLGLVLLFVVRFSIFCSVWGTRIIFWRGVRPKVWNPHPFLRIFFLQNGWFYFFFSKFSQVGTLSKGFFCLKNDQFYNFCNFSKLGPSSIDFFLTKTFGRHILVCLNMWVPLARIFVSNRTV